MVFSLFFFHLFVFFFLSVILRSILSTYIIVLSGVSPGACAVFPTTSMEPPQRLPLPLIELQENLPMLEGTPILEGVPIYQEILGTPAEAWYFPTLLQIPGEVSDPATLAKLSKLNGYILYKESCYNEMNPGYSQAIQRVLDRTAAVSLPEKLEYFINLEETRFQSHVLAEILWQTFAKEPNFLFSLANRHIFEESVRLTLDRYGLASNVNQLHDLILSLRLEGQNSPLFWEVIHNFYSKLS